MTTSTANDDDIYDMSSLDKVQLPSVGNIIWAFTQIAANLGDFPCEAPGANDYGHQFIIFPTNIWLTLEGIDAEVVVEKPAAFNGTTNADRFIYDSKLKIYTEKEKHKKGAIRMIKYIFHRMCF